MDPDHTRPESWQDIVPSQAESESAHPQPQEVTSAPMGSALRSLDNYSNSVPTQAVEGHDRNGEYVSPTNFGEVQARKSSPCPVSDSSLFANDPSYSCFNGLVFSALDKNAQEQTPAPYTTSPNRQHSGSSAQEAAMSYAEGSADTAGNFTNYSAPYATCLQPSVAGQLGYSQANLGSQISKVQAANDPARLPQNGQHPASFQANPPGLANEPSELSFAHYAAMEIFPSYSSAASSEHRSLAVSHVNQPADVCPLTSTMMPSIQTLSETASRLPMAPNAYNPIPAPEHASTQPLAIDSSAAEMSPKRDLYTPEIYRHTPTTDFEYGSVASASMYQVEVPSSYASALSASGIKVANSSSGILADAELGARRASELIADILRESATASSIYGREGLPSREVAFDSLQTQISQYEKPRPAHASQPSFRPRANFARAKPLLQAVLPTAEEFVFDPEVYNEKHLLETYPDTFCLPTKVDVLSLTSAELIQVIEEVVLPTFDQQLFTLDWLKSNIGDNEVRIRDLRTKKDTNLKFNEFMAMNQHKHYSEIHYYGKDLDCPHEWQISGKSFVPPYLQYLGPNDLNRLLPDYLTIDNLMIYVGHQGTYTASHFDICGSVGHNLMVYTDEGCSALWFMVGRDHANDARKFWHQHGGGNTSIDQDNCALPANVMGQAKFPIFAFEQRLGDFVMVPSEGGHQVVNLGQGGTIKYSWNRNTVQSLDHCIRRILPVNRRILKMETYRTKTMVEQGVLQLGRRLQEHDLESVEPSLLERFTRDYCTLLQTYAEIISYDVVDTSYAIQTLQRPERADDPMPHTRVCDYCHCDIWNVWFHCGECSPETLGHDFCADCFAENRRCLNPQRIAWLCHRPVEECFRDLQRFTELVNTSPVLSRLASFKPVPTYSNIKELENLHPGTFSPMTLAVRNNDKLKIPPFKADHKTCHQCAVSRFNYDMVYCAGCKFRRYCHGCLSNRYAVDPLRWRARRAGGTCNCAKCVREFGADTVLPLADNPFCQKDFNGNYYLGFGLSYFPVGTTNYLVPNLVDFQTFLGTKKGMDKATAKNVQEKLIPYTGRIYNMPKDSRAKGAGGRTLAEPKKRTPKKLKDASAHEASEGMGKPGSGSSSQGKPKRDFREVEPSADPVHTLAAATPKRRGRPPKPKATSSPTTEAAPQAPHGSVAVDFPPLHPTLDILATEAARLSNEAISGRPQQGAQAEVKAATSEAKPTTKGARAKRGPYKKRVTVPKVSDEGASSNDAKAEQLPFGPTQETGAPSQEINPRDHSSSVSSGARCHAGTASHAGAGSPAFARIGEAPAAPETTAQATALGSTVAALQLASSEMPVAGAASRTGAGSPAFAQINEAFVAPESMAGQSEIKQETLNTVSNSH
ncbi:hypothetical protein L0F63_003004 [Massospora cicadina]|nr:hypothetical protein L0F63_003004 [Massospora cicadina]